MSIGIDDLARLIAQELEVYSEDVETVVRETIDVVSKEALECLKNSPEVKKLKGEGKYKKGFFIKNEYKASGKNKGFYKLKIANKEYQLTHLLEKGHAKQNGGRTKAFPHWIEAQKTADTLQDRIKEAIKHDT